MARETWTDERLDDLKENVNRRFDQVDKRFDRVDKDLREVKGELREFQTETNARFDSMQRTMVIGFITLFTGIVASIITAILAG